VRGKQRVPRQSGLDIPGTLHRVIGAKVARFLGVTTSACDPSSALRRPPRVEGMDLIHSKTTSPKHMVICTTMHLPAMSGRSPPDKPVPDVIRET